MGKGGNTTSALLRTKAKEEAIAPLASSKDKETAVPTTGTVSTTAAKWWMRGGMHVNEVGMGLNVAIPPILLVLSFTSKDGFFGFNFTKVFLAVWFFNIATAFFVHKMRTVFCVIAVPVYMASLLNIFTLQSPIVPTLVLTMAIAIWRVGVCMSVCMHRYAAHAAFKCGPLVQLYLNILGCMAHQGGVIWWASQHRCHHKHCDLPRDPHSAVQVGTERAFAFFQERVAVEEEFAPKHNDNWYLRILDTWSFAVTTAEMMAVSYFFGRDGLFVSYTSIWICQTVTLWFNIANHPEDAPGAVCKAANYHNSPKEKYPAFHLLHILYPLVGNLVGENGHHTHHEHFQLAKRDSTDMAYYLFIMPLEAMGLVWDVKDTPLK